MKKLARKILFFAFIFAAAASVFAVDVPISTFPLDKYDQNISAWINPSDTDHDNKSVFLPGCSGAECTLSQFTKIVDLMKN